MRIRTIKPEFFTHEGLFDAERESGLPLRLAFTGLWCAADREGRFRWEPRRLGVSILPYDEIDFSRVLHALLTRGFLVKYTADGEDYGAIPSFKRHQIINNREKPSILPEPLASSILDASSTRAARVEHACPTPLKWKGREGNMEGKGIGREHPSLPSSDSYDVPPSDPPTKIDRSRPEGGKDGPPGISSPLEEEAPPGVPETVFLTIARKLDIPDDFARRVHLDLVATGWASANGSRVVSPASYLAELWRREKAKALRPPGTAPAANGGAREAWHVDRDLARVKAEIARIEAEEGNRNGGPGWDEHEERHRESWLTVVQACHDEAREKLPSEFATFEASLAKLASMAPDGVGESREFRLGHFVDSFPDDAPDFRRWDREWNPSPWADPRGLKSEARAEVKILRGEMRKLEEERRRLLTEGVET